MDLSKLPERFQHEEPDPNAHQRFMRVLTGLVAVPKAEAMGGDAFRSTVKKSKTKTTKRKSNQSN